MRACLIALSLVLLPAIAAGQSAATVATASSLDVTVPPAVKPGPLRAAAAGAILGLVGERSHPSYGDTGGRARTPRIGVSAHGNGVSTATSLSQCRSKRKGALLGAVVGTAAAGVFATFVARDVAGAVPGAAQGGRRYVAYWMAAGAGAGALAGLWYCS